MPDLATLANELNLLADKATDAIRAREQRFEVIRIGVEAGFTHNGMVISYKKHNGRWRIMIDGRPALECKREARLEAATLLDNLESAIKEKISNAIKHQRRIV